MPRAATVADRVRPPARGGRGPLRFVPSTLGVLTLAAAGVGVAIVPADLEAIPIPGPVCRPIKDVVGPELIVVSRPEETLGPVLAFLRSLDTHDLAGAPAGQALPAGRGPAPGRE